METGTPQQQGIPGGAAVSAWGCVPVLIPQSNRTLNQLVYPGLDEVTWSLSTAGLRQAQTPMASVQARQQARTKRQRLHGTASGGGTAAGPGACASVCMHTFTSPPAAGPRSRCCLWCACMLACSCKPGILARYAVHGLPLAWLHAKDHAACGSVDPGSMTLKSALQHRSHAVQAAGMPSLPPCRWCRTSSRARG